MSVCARYENMLVNPKAKKKYSKPPAHDSAREMTAGLFILAVAGRRMLSQGQRFEGRTSTNILSDLKPRPRASLP